MFVAYLVVIENNDNHNDDDGNNNSNETHSQHWFPFDNNMIC